MRTDLFVDTLNVVETTIVDKGGNMNNELFKEETAEAVKDFAGKVQQWDADASNEVTSAYELKDVIQRFIRDYVLDYGPNEHIGILRDAGNVEVKDEDDYGTIHRMLLTVREYLYERENEMNETMKYCDCCGKLHSKSDLHTVAGGEMVCSECLKNYELCEECGEWHLPSDLTWIASESKNVCRDCRRAYFRRCEECNEWYRKDDMQWSSYHDGYICDGCSELFVTCEECGCEMRAEYAEYYEEANGYLCDDCRRDFFNELASQYIYEWHSDDIEWQVRSLPIEVVNSDTFLLGTEHELSGDKRYAKPLLDIVNGDDFEQNIVLCDDGSIEGEGGFEIVSQPMTPLYFYNVFLPKYKEGLEFLKENGFRSQDVNCGIHIHFSKVRDVAQLTKMVNILYGGYDSQTAWKRMADRDNYSMNRWCPVNNRKVTSYDLMFQYYSSKVVDERYTALNFDCSRTSTHELRIFNSTLNINTYISCVETVLSLLDFTSQKHPRGLFVDMFDYLEWLNDYDTIRQYPRVHSRACDNQVFEMYGIGAFNEAQKPQPQVYNEPIKPEIEESLDLLFQKNEHNSFFDTQRSVNDNIPDITDDDINELIDLIRDEDEEEIVTAVG